MHVHLRACVRVCEWVREMPTCVNVHVLLVCVFTVCGCQIRYKLFFYFYPKFPMPPYLPHPCLNSRAFLLFSELIKMYSRFWENMSNWLATVRILFKICDITILRALDRSSISQECLFHSGLEPSICRVVKLSVSVNSQSSPPSCATSNYENLGGLSGFFT